MPKTNTQSYEVGEDINLTFKKDQRPLGCGPTLVGKLDGVLNIDGVSKKPQIYVKGDWYDASDFEEKVKVYMRNRTITVERAAA